MSVRILRSELSEQDVELIRQMLILYPQTTPTYGQQNYYVAKEEKEPIVFYLVKKNENGVEYVWLPFCFGNVLSKKYINASRTYPAKNFDFKSTLRENQVEVVKEAITDLNTTYTANINLPTGFGKSVIAEYLSTRIKLLTLVVIHLTTLTDQWVNDYKVNTTAKVWVVPTQDKFEVPKEFDVIISMDTRVTNIPEKILDQIGLVVYDEIDRQTTRSRVLPFLSVQPKFIIGLTATPDLRSDGMDTMQKALTGTKLIIRKIEKNITLFKIHTNINPPVTKTARGTDWSKLNRHLSRDDTRNKMIINLVLQNYHHKILIVTEFQEHCIFLHDELKKLNKSTEFLTGNKDTYENCQVLVGSKKKVGIGFDDINTAKNSDGIRIQVLILASTIKDESLLTQILGRIRDSNPIIFYLIDDNPTIKRHWTACNKWLKARNLGFIDWKSPIEKLITDKEGKIIEKAPEEPKTEQSNNTAVKLNLIN